MNSAVFIQRTKLLTQRLRSISKQQEVRKWAARFKKVEKQLPEHVPVDLLPMANLVERPKVMPKAGKFIEGLPEHIQKIQNLVLTLKIGKNHSISGKEKNALKALRESYLATLFEKAQYHTHYPKGYIAVKGQLGELALNSMDEFKALKGRMKKLLESSLPGGPWHSDPNMGRVIYGLMDQSGEMSDFVYAIPSKDGKKLFILVIAESKSKTNGLDALGRVKNSPLGPVLDPGQLEKNFNRIAVSNSNIADAFEGTDLLSTTTPQIVVDKNITHMVALLPPDASGPERLAGSFTQMRSKFKNTEIWERKISDGILSEFSRAVFEVVKEIQKK